MADELLLESARKERMHRPCILAQESSHRFMKVLVEPAGKPQLQYFLEGLPVNVTWCGDVPSLMDFYWGFVC